MIRRCSLLLFLALFVVSLGEAKTLDLYKVLGIDKSASQRDIQKAFHRLSLQYHPDKNRSKGAQEKFSEINNAYEILSDEEKRKNYDTYGDEKGRPGFDAGNFGNPEGNTYFTGSGPQSGHSTFNPGGWQNMGGQRHSKSFSFGSPSGFSFSDIFSNIFGSGMNGGNQFGGFRGSGSPNSRFNSPVDIEDVDPQFFDKQIRDRGMTWLLLFYTPSARGYHVFESIMEDVTGLLSGAVKAGRINCLSEQAFCKDLGVKISRSARLFLYSYRNSDHGSLVEYSGGADTKSLKSFCQEQLPRFSKQVDLDRFDIFSAAESLPQLLLLSTKKDTPVIWRVLSGLYRKRFLFYNAEVRDVTDPTLRRLGVDALPAVVGRLADGEIHILRAGISVKDLRSGIDELKPLVEDFGRKSKKAASSRAKKPSQTETQGPSVPYLTSSNFGSVCGDKTAVCIIGVFRSSNARERLEVILSAVSQKTLVRRPIHAWASENSVSYSLLDAEKQSAFLSAFDKSAYRSVDKLLIALKPRKGKFVAFTGEFSMEEVEKFISSVINGDVRFSPIRQKPVLK